ncbi:NADPH-dependent FMN reductase [Xylaria flabelliformis]|nr:NADPH-dependent FMN reductase [Xylaria flabelliformis]
MSKSVALITMSLRPSRIGGNVANFVKPYLEKELGPDNIKIAPVDLRDFNLPIFNENVAPAMVPAMAQFQHEHSKAWSAEIAKHDGYVLVIPEYNYGVAGGTKNAIDYLLNEWKGKPLTIVSYGAQGGGKANQQAKEILSGMGLRVTETRPQLAFADARAEMGGILSEGKISPESRAKWEGQSSDIIKAAEELKGLLLQPNQEANAPTH